MFINRAKRIVVSSLKDLSRNLWLNVATIMIIVMALFTTITMMAIEEIGDYALISLQEKIDISIQFQDDAEESKILELKKDLENLGEIKEVNYVSKEQALVNFKENNKDNVYINQSIEELGENPLFAVLNVKANNMDKYSQISEYVVNNDNYKDIVEKVNYKENERAINNLSRILAVTRDGIFGLTILFVLISILTAFNTIRLAMYSHKTEIEIMRLVGASNWYIRMPFVIQGIILGLVGCFITVLIIFPIVNYISPGISQFLPGFDLYSHLMNNILNIILFLSLSGVGIGVFSSIIAIRRYLKA